MDQYYRERGGGGLWGSFGIRLHRDCLFLGNANQGVMRYSRGRECLITGRLPIRGGRLGHLWRVSGTRYRWQTMLLLMSVVTGTQPDRDIDRALPGTWAMLFPKYPISLESSRGSPKSNGTSSFAAPGTTTVKLNARDTYNAVSHPGARSNAYL